MNKLDFSDFYRFVSSLGMVLIGFGLAIPYVVVRDAESLMLSASAYDSLIPIAQTAVTLRTLWYLLMSVAAICISPGLIASGLTLVAWGLWMWWSRQRVRDAREDLGLKKETEEFRRMTQDERQRSAAEDIGSEVHPIDAGPDTTSAAGPSTADASAIDRYLHLQDEVTRALERQLPEYEIVSHVNLASDQFDVIVHRPNQPDTVMEIKPLRRSPSLAWVHQQFAAHSARTRHYRAATNQPANGLLVVIVPRPENVHEVQTILRDLPSYVQPNVNVIVVPEGELATYDYRRALDDAAN